MAYDDFFKQSFKDEYGDATQSEISVGALEKSFDLRLQGKHPSIQESDLIPTAFKQYKDNIIEFKSGHDKYQQYDIFKLQGDFSYFAFNRKMDLRKGYTNSCLWFLIVNPSPFTQFYQENDIKKDRELGYYHIPGCSPKIKIIVINELDTTKKENYLLLLQSSKKAMALKK